jgi:hypothetical protein
LGGNIDEYAFSKALWGRGVKVPKSLKLKASCFLPKKWKKNESWKSLVNVQLWWALTWYLRLIDLMGCCVINFTWGLFFFPEFYNFLKKIFWADTMFTQS